MAWLLLLLAVAMQLLAEGALPEAQACSARETGCGGGARTRAGSTGAG